MLEFDFGKKFIQPIAVGLGFFDCVHTGHRAVFEACRQLAAETEAMPAAFTFRDVPAFGDKSGSAVYTYAERLERFREEGVKVCISALFSQVCGMSAGSFLKTLESEYHVRGIVVGSDFRFGAGAKGDAALLRDFCRKKGIALRVIEVGEDKVSSSRIKRLLCEGTLEEANRLLGAPYRLSGKVVSGDSIGRTMQIRTANVLLPPEKFHIAEGVYAGYTTVCGRTFRSVTNIGPRPTRDSDEYRAETHLIGADLDLYGQTVTIYLLRYLRPVKKFASMEELKAQIARDIQSAVGSDGTGERA